MARILCFGLGFGAGCACVSIYLVLQGGLGGFETPVIRPEIVIGGSALRGDNGNAGLAQLAKQELVGAPQIDSSTSAGVASSTAAEGPFANVLLVVSQMPFGATEKPQMYQPFWDVLYLLPKGGVQQFAKGGLAATSCGKEHEGIAPCLGQVLGHLSGKNPVKPAPAWEAALRSDGKDSLKGVLHVTPDFWMTPFFGASMNLASVWTLTPVREQCKPWDTSNMRPIYEKARGGNPPLRPKYDTAFNDLDHGNPSFSKRGTIVYCWQGVEPFYLPRKAWPKWSSAVGILAKYKLEEQASIPLVLEFMKRSSCSFETMSGCWKLWGAAAPHDIRNHHCGIKMNHSDSSSVESLKGIWETYQDYSDQQKIDARSEATLHELASLKEALVVRRPVFEPIPCRDDIARIAQGYFFETGYAAEIGVKFGKFAQRNLQHWKGNYMMIDAWQFRKGDIMDENQNDAEQLKKMKRAEELTASAGNRRVLIREYSVIAAKQFEDGKFDWVYIDALHTRAAVIADLRAWYPKVRRGGLLSGDDYGDKEDTELVDSNKWGGIFTMTHQNANFKWGVISAMRAFTAEVGAELHITWMYDCYPYPAWYFIKP